jgi:DNA-binding CsgD family transcriptional regulator
MYYQLVSNNLSLEIKDEETNKFLNKIKAFICIIDIQNARLLWVNKYSYNKVGFSAAELLNMSSDELFLFIHPDFRELLMQIFTDLSNSNLESHSCFIKVKTKGNRWIWSLATFTVYEKDPYGKISKVLSYITEADINQFYTQLKILANNERANEQPSQVKLLSTRERKIIELISNGESDKEISEKLGISIYTAKTHRKRIIHKLGFRKSSALIKYAIENGLC